MTVELTETAKKQLGKLDTDNRARILRFLKERLQKLSDPRSIGEALRGEQLGEYWKYRAGDYRLICKIEDARLIILVLRVGHRRDVYREK